MWVKVLSLGGEFVYCLCGFILWKKVGWNDVLESFNCRVKVFYFILLERRGYKMILI